MNTFINWFIYSSLNNSFYSLDYIQPKDSEPFVNVKSEMTRKEAGVH